MFFDRYTAKAPTTAATIKKIRKMISPDRKRAKDLMHPETAKLLEEWLRFLAVNGEKKAFKMIRKEKKY